MYLVNLQKKKNKLQKGFTVIEILVSLGLFSIIIAGFSQMIVNSMKYQKEVVLESTYTDLTSNVSQLINTSDSCTDALKGQGTSGTVKIFKPGSSQSEVLFEESKEYQGWIISKLQFSDPVDISIEKKIVKLNIDLERKIQSSETIKKRSKEFFVQLSVDASNKIEKCWATNTISDSCVDLGGLYDPSKNPPCSLKTTVTGQSCGSNQSVSGFDANGKIICVDSPVKTVYVSIPADPIPVPAPTPTPAPTPPEEPIGCAGKSATCTMSQYGVSGQVWASCDSKGQLKTRALLKGVDSGWLAGTFATVKVLHNKQFMNITANSGSFTSVSGFITNGAGFYISCSAVLK